MNYVLVDFENVPALDLDLIAGKPLTVVLVLGKRHGSLSVEIVKKLLKYPGQVRLVETGLNGKNALDFVLAYQVGLQAAADPQGCFHIVSGDKGFDALIMHLNDSGISAWRQDAFAKIPLLSGEALPPSTALLSSKKPPLPVSAPASGKGKAAAAAELDSRVKDMTERFAKNQNRPKSIKTLLAHIHTRFGKKLPASEVQAIVDKLIARKKIEITPVDKVIYKV